MHRIYFDARLDVFWCQLLRVLRATYFHVNMNAYTFGVKTYGMSRIIFDAHLDIFWCPLFRVLRGTTFVWIWMCKL